MSDVMRILAKVSHNQAEAAADDLEKIATKQEEKLEQKKDARYVQEFNDKIKADGIVTFDELVQLHALRTEIGSTEEAFWATEADPTLGYRTVNEFEPHEMGTNPWKYDAEKYSGAHGNNSHFYLDIEGDSEAERKAKQGMDLIGKELDNHVKELEDDQSLLQFKIQMFTSDLQNAENVRSQAEKRLETQRKDLTRNWGG